MRGASLHSDPSLTLHLAFFVGDITLPKAFSVAGGADACHCSPCLHAPPSCPLSGISVEDQGHLSVCMGGDGPGRPLAGCLHSKPGFLDRFTGRAGDGAGGLLPCLGGAGWGYVSSPSPH